MKSICLFDLDGTLTDPGVGITKSVAYALAAFGIRIHDLSELNKFIGPPLRDSFRDYYHFTEAEIDRAIDTYREYFAETGILENELYSGVMPMLERIRAHGATLAIATSKPTVFAKRVATHFGLAQYFDLIAGSELDGTRSRKGEVIGYALDIIDPGRKLPAVMVGDREHDIIGAREAGIDAIGVTWGYGSREELEAARARWIVGSPQELPEVVVEGLLR